MEKRAQILVVEDDRDINEAICCLLQNEEFRVFSALTTRQARNYVSRVDLVVLDLQLPDGCGLELLKWIREDFDVPVIILSALGEGADRITGLELGADDYLPKPFIPRELLARINANLNRYLGNVGKGAKQNLSLDEKARVARMDGQEIAFSPQEFQVLHTLFQTPGKTFSRQELMNAVWGERSSSDTRKVDLVVSRVRTKFADQGLDCSIKSVRGVGYRVCNGRE